MKAVIFASCHPLTSFQPLTYIIMDGGRLYPYPRGVEVAGEGRDDGDLDSFEDRQNGLSVELIMNIQCILN